MQSSTFIITMFTLLFCGTLVSAQKSYNALVHEGNRRYEQNKYEAAASSYLEAIKTDSKDYTGYYNLGNALYRSKKYEEAITQYTKASELSQNLPDKAAALHNIGNAYMQLNKPEKAAEFYKQSLKQEPRNEQTRKNYEIAKLKEQENKQNQGNGGGGEGNKKQDQSGQGNEKKDGRQGSGSGPDNEGNDKSGSNPNQNKDNNNGALPKGMQDAILNRVSEKERETAKKILNKDSYSMPESNEKDW